MKQALILHGWEGYSTNSWFPWLKKELEEKGYNVIIPDLPNSAFPVLEEQLETIERYASDFRSGNLIIGHSLGSKLALEYVHQHNIQGINLIFVGPSFPRIRPELLSKNPQLESYVNHPINIKELNNKYTVFLSEDDPFIPLKGAEEYYSQLENIEFVEFEDKGHFNTKSGIFELPEILEYI